MIGLTLVSLIMVLLFGGLRLGSRSWESLETHTQKSEDLRLVRGFLQRALLQARKVDWALEDRRFALFFGNTTQLEFVTPLSEYVGLGGLYLVRVAAVDRGPRRDLVLQRWLVHPDTLAGSDEIPEWLPLEAPVVKQDPQDAPLGVYGTTTLLQDVSDVEFSYYGMLEREPKNDWLDLWEDRSSLPLLVKIRIAKPGSEWLDLVVPLVDG
jgi:general secretion pathway protein J